MRILVFLGFFLIFSASAQEPVAPATETPAAVVAPTTAPTAANAITPASTKAFQKLQVVFELNLINMTWEELGLKEAKSFSDPIIATWEKWFKDHIPSNVNEVTFCRDTCRDFLEWEQIEQDQKMAIPEPLQNTMWLKVSVFLRRNPDFSETESVFEWEGSAVLLDANTKRVLGSYQLLPEQRKLRGMDQKGINSAIASALYRAPLDAFQKLVKKAEENPKSVRLERLIIRGNKNLDDVLSLMTLLKQEGASLGLITELDLLTQTEVHLLCFYSGEEKSFTDLLSRLKELKSSHNYTLVNEFTGINHVLKLISE